MGFLVKSHLQSYPSPNNINSFWNMGFLLIIVIILQIITGILLALHYTPDINYAYYSVMHIIREVYYGWCLRYIHSNGASFVFALLFIHIGRGLYYGSYYYNPNTWFSGIIIFILLMVTAFMGYVLPWALMSFWAATVITNLLSPFPCLIEWVCGGFYVSNPTLKRFFLFHFILPFIVIKDIFGLFIVITLYTLQLFLGIFSLSHPDNAFEVSGIVTPLHIVPEWYFLSFYSMLKAIPNKNAGFIILLTSILILFGEAIKNISTLSRLTYFNGNFSISCSCFFLTIICNLWIGAQFPKEIFISYGRILTLFYYFIIIYILFGSPLP